MIYKTNFQISPTELFYTSKIIKMLLHTITILLFSKQDNQMYIKIWSHSKIRKKKASAIRLLQSLYSEGGKESFSFLRLKSNTNEEIMIWRSLKKWYISNGFLKRKCLQKPNCTEFSAKDIRYKSRAIKSKDGIKVSHTWDIS